MTISIKDYRLEDETHNLYDITFYTHQIHTLVTHTPSFANRWLAENIPRTPLRGRRPTIVGLDVEWRPNFSRYIDNPIATLQICIGHSCLIYQLKHSPTIPPSLSGFLSNGVDFVFVGVGVASDIRKLVEDYGLSVRNPVDLRALAAERMCRNELKNVGLKELTEVVLGKVIEKPRRITLSRWDNLWLTPDQVQYACLDAFLSFEIGRSLYALDS